jgi:hypothetical protein
MKNFTRILALSLLVGAAGVRAHDGDHGDVPGVLKPQKGGRMKPFAGGLLVELVVDKATNTVKLYPLDKDYKAVPLTDLKLEASAQRRRVDKAPVALKLEAKADHFAATFDPQNRYPFNVDVKTTYKGQTDTAQYIVDRN